MAVAEAVKAKMSGRANAGIRGMFETGLLLKKRFGAENVYDFSLGNPDLEPPALLSDTVKGVAADVSPGRHAYMPNAGLQDCREAVAARVAKEQGIILGAENVIMSCGAAGALNVFLKAVLNPQERVLVSVPFFPEYAHYADNHGGVLIPVPCKADMSLNLAAFEQAFFEAETEGKAVAAVIVNSPNNPSGKVYDAQTVADLASIMRSYGKKTGKKPYLVCDEPYRDIVYDGVQVPSVFPLYDESLVVSSFAKNFSLPGERIGYIALNPAMENVGEVFQACAFANRILGFVNAPAFFQRVIARSQGIEGDYSAYEKKRRLMTEAASGAGLEYIKPEGAFYLFCKVPAPGGKVNSGAPAVDGGKEVSDGKEDADNKKGAENDLAFCAHLQKFRILCVPGSVFGCPGWFRAAYCTNEKTIINCKEPLKQACAQWTDKGGNL